MIINWSDLPVWLFTSFVGAAMVKVLDLVVFRYQEARRLHQEKARTILAHITQFGELAQLYRFMAYASAEVVRAEDGTLKTDDQGGVVMQKKLLEPEPRFEQAVQSLKGTDISSAISQKIASIRLASADAIDCAVELDPSGSLRNSLNDLYIKTVSGIELVLRTKDHREWGKSVNSMVTALAEADETRRRTRAILAKHLR
jgi:hypothetical protein